MSKLKFLSIVMSLLMVLCVIVVIPVYALDLPEDSVYSASQAVEILDNNPYDVKTVFEIGLNVIDEISRGIDAFSYWQNCEVINFEFLHSFETGKVTHALFDILGTNGKYGYMILDCETNESDSFSASESPYRMLHSETVNLIAESDILDSYLFYAPMSYGCGVLNDDNEIDIYNIRDLVNGTEVAVLENATFQTTEEQQEKENRTLVGDADDIAEYATRIAMASSLQARAITYPDEYLISGVPDYQQSTGCLCIPTSMSNIIGYWDENGYPNLVPWSYTNSRENYIKTNIVSYLEAAGGTGANASIDPAFEAYIADNGEYRYVGIGVWYPDFGDLQIEIYASESPCMIGFPAIYGVPHSTTGVGYSTVSGEKVIVHDNWSTTGEDVYQDWSDVDYLFSCMIRLPS